MSGLLSVSPVLKKNCTRFLDLFETKLIVLYKVFDDELKNIKAQKLPDTSYESPVDRSINLQSPKDCLEYSMTKLQFLVDRYELNQKLKNLKYDEDLIVPIQYMERLRGKNRETKKILLTAFLKWKQLNESSQMDIDELTDRIIKNFFVKKEDFSEQFILQSWTNPEPFLKNTIFEVIWLKLLENVFGEVYKKKCGAITAEKYDTNFDSIKVDANVEEILKELEKEERDEEEIKTSIKTYKKRLTEQMEVVKKTYLFDAVTGMDTIMDSMERNMEKKSEDEEKPAPAAQPGTKNINIQHTHAKAWNATFN